MSLLTKARLTRTRPAMIAAALAAGVTWAQPLAAGQIDITVTGVTSTEGFILIGVASPTGADQFPYPTTWAASVRLPAKQGRIVKTLSLPPGRYAVAVYHDRDNSGKLETGAFGIPKEPVGFSNNPSFLFGPPSFDAAAIQLDDTARQLTIELVE